MSEHRCVPKSMQHVWSMWISPRWVPKVVIGGHTIKHCYIFKYRALKCRPRWAPNSKIYPPFVFMPTIHTRQTDFSFIQQECVKCEKCRTRKHIANTSSKCLFIYYIYVYIVCCVLCHVCMLELPFRHSFRHQLCAASTTHWKPKREAQLEIGVCACVCCVKQTMRRNLIFWKIYIRYMQTKETGETGGDNLNQAGSYKSWCDGLAWHGGETTTQRRRQRRRRRRRHNGTRGKA